VWIGQVGSWLHDRDGERGAVAEEHRTLAIPPATEGIRHLRAVLTTAHGDRSRLAYRTDHPDPVADAGHVVLRVVAAAVNYHDIFTRRGMPGIRIPLPVIAGSDIAGTVAAVGPGVTQWLPGDRTLVDPVFRDGSRVGMLGETADGGRAQLVRVAAEQLIRVPDAVSLEHAAALPLAYGTAYRMVVDRGRVGAGERVLVLGASGGVGVASVQLCLHLGAEVIACAGSPAKVERLRALGAHHVIDYSATSFRERIHELYGRPRVTGGGGVDVAINFTGGDTWLDTQKSLNRGGRLLCCGATAGYELTTDARYLWTLEHEIIGSNGWTPDDLERLLELVAGGRLTPVIDARLPLDQAAEAERRLEEREVFGKVLLIP
jgi:alcohol dehydrogenase